MFEVICIVSCTHPNTFLTCLGKQLVFLHVIEYMSTCIATFLQRVAAANACNIDPTTCMFYVHTYTGTASGTADTGGLSTDLMIALGVGIVTLAAIILVSCCAKKHCNNQMQGEPIICTISGIA